MSIEKKVIIKQIIIDLVLVILIVIAGIYASIKIFPSYREVNFETTKDYECKLATNCVCNNVSCSCKYQNKDITCDKSLIN